MNKTITALILAVTLFAGIRTGYGEERILNFHSEIEVKPDSSLIVTETIKVTADNTKIKRGIYRDFPTTYRDSFLLTRKVGFKVLKASRDGRPENWRLEDIAGGKRIYLGKFNKIISPGIHTYRLTYWTDRQLGFFENHDELYWNVTGNDWDFPIDRASAEVILPEGAGVKILKTGGYTGPSGAKEQAFKTSTSHRGKAFFSTTSPLDVKEGLTIVVSWPKGFVQPPKGNKTLELMKDNPQVFTGATGLLVIGIYYLLAWYLKGRDPRAGTIIPLFVPPENLSPSAVRFIREMGFDNHTFGAALVSMAAQGCLKIEESQGIFTLQKGQTDLEVLFPEEQKMARQLFRSTNKVILKSTNHRTIGGARLALLRSLSAKCNRIYFKTNLGMFLGGVGLSLLSIIATLAAGGFQPDQFGIGVWLVIWTIGTTFLIAQGIGFWRSSKKVAGGCLTVFSIPFCLGEVLGIYFFLQVGSLPLLLILVITGLLNWLFYHLLKSPTQAGRKLLDEIEGFRLYLSVAESDRLDMPGKPRLTTKLFESYLPYALALGVAQPWSERFSAEVAKSGIKPSSYQPAWYSSGTGGAPFPNPSSLVSSLGSSLTGALGSSASAPGTSSGGGGGGSSGGGGGGGGGGGW